MQTLENITSNYLTYITWGLMGLTVFLILWADRIRDRA